MKKKWEGRIKELETKLEAMGNEIKEIKEGIEKIGRWEKWEGNKKERGDESV